MSTLSQLRAAVDRMIAQQGEDAPCAYWIYSKEDAYVIHEDDRVEYIYDNGVDNAKVVVNALDELQEVDYVYTVIQEFLDELVEEKRILQQQEADEQEADDGVPSSWTAVANHFHAS